MKDDAKKLAAKAAYGEYLVGKNSIHIAIRKAAQEHLTRAVGLGHHQAHMEAAAIAIIAAAVAVSNAAATEDVAQKERYVQASEKEKTTAFALYNYAKLFHCDRRAGRLLDAFSGTVGEKIKIAKGYLPNHPENADAWLTLAQPQTAEEYYFIGMVYKNFDIAKAKECFTSSAEDGSSEFAAKAREEYSLLPTVEVKEVQPSQELATPVGVDDSFQDEKSGTNQDEEFVANSSVSQIEIELGRCAQQANCSNDIVDFNSMTAEDCYEYFKKCESTGSTVKKDHLMKKALVSAALGQHYDAQMALAAAMIKGEFISGNRERDSIATYAFNFFKLALESTGDEYEKEVAKRHALALRKGSDNSKLQLAELYLFDDDPAYVLGWLHLIEGEGFAVCFLYGKIYDRNGEFDQAIAFYERALTAKPQNEVWAEIKYLIGLAHVALLQPGNKDHKIAAKLCFTQCVGVESDFKSDAYYQLSLPWTDFDEEKRRENRQLAANEGHWEAICELSYGALIKGNHQEAAKWFSKIGKLDFDGDEVDLGEEVALAFSENVFEARIAQVSLCNIFLDLNKTALALYWLIMLINSDQQDHQEVIKDDLVEIIQQCDDKDIADQIETLLVEQEWQDAQYLFKLADCLRRVGRDEQAHYWYHNVLPPRYAGGFLPPKLEVVELTQTAGNNVAGKPWTELTAAQISEAYYRLGELYKKRDVAKAKAYFAVYAEDDVSDYAARANYELSLEWTGEDEQNRHERLEQAAGGKHTQAVYEMGCYCLRRGEVDEAKAWFKDLDSLNSEYKKYHLWENVSLALSQVAGWAQDAQRQLYDIFYERQDVVLALYWLIMLKGSDQQADQIFATRHIADILQHLHSEGVTDQIEANVFDNTEIMLALANYWRENKEYNKAFDWYHKILLSQRECMQTKTIEAVSGLYNHISVNVRYYYDHAKFEQYLQHVRWGVKGAVKFVTCGLEIDNSRLSLLYAYYHQVERRLLSCRTL